MDVYMVIEDRGNRVVLLGIFDSLENAEYLKDDWVYIMKVPLNVGLKEILYVD